MLNLKEISAAINEISESIDQGFWQEATLKCETIFDALQKIEKSEIVLQLRFNLAALFIDSGSFLKNKNFISKGIKILEEDSEFYAMKFDVNYFYNLANAKLCIANDCGYKNDLVSYEESILYGEAKNLYWQVFKTIDKSIDSALYYQNLINLANTLQQQYRFSEAMHIYEKIVQTKLDYPEAFKHQLKSKHVFITKTL